MDVVSRLGLVVAVLVFGLSAQNSNKPDFTGTWRLDIQRTRFGGTLPPKSLVLHIEHVEPKLQIVIITTTDKDERQDTLKLTTDGKQYAQAEQGQACTASAQWYWWEGRRLVVQVNCPDHTVSRRLTLGPMGKILTTVLTMKDRSGEKKTYEFFVRQ